MASVRVGPCPLHMVSLRSPRVCRSPSAARVPRGRVRLAIFCDGREKVRSSGDRINSSGQLSNLENCDQRLDVQILRSKTTSSTEDGPSAQSHLDLLEQLTSENDRSNAGTGKSIAQQLAEELPVEEAEEIIVPLAKSSLEMAPLTISQKRNIRRQNYLNQVSKRNDAPFFTAVFLFVIVPPAAILGLAAFTGYVDLFP